METILEVVEGTLAPQGPVLWRSGTGRQDPTAPRQAPAPADRMDRFYAAVRLVVRFWLPGGSRAPAQEMTRITRRAAT
jgi:hypothetical protein